MKTKIQKMRNDTYSRYTFNHIRAIFFPRDFNEKYKYLGAVPYQEGTSLFKALYPLILALDNYAKPWWCPRWFLRFLHLFGSDNSVVRVRNRFLHDLQRRITRNVLVVDYKTKWEWYDLRISIYAPDEFIDMADAIEQFFYQKGRKVDLLEKIKAYNISEDKYKDYYTIEQLEKVLTEYKESLKNTEI